ncbi:sensor histidine kinase [Acinetobacter gyllenbergii]|uniref:sensor histidine kinase n=1 Tax=Acinetobacter gyllenbergii TaxID=134534 RepID=UPI000806A7A0|nr:ATP-binding protein [Acinetobacter gyllenbergii]OBY76139.1 histidine kinase [Acinetobacter gyllenbergii]
MLFINLVRSYKNQALSTRMMWSISIISLILLILIAISAYKIALEESEEIIDQQMIEMSKFLISREQNNLRSVFDPHKRYGERDVFIDITDNKSLPQISQQYNYIVPAVQQAQFIIKKTSRGPLKIYVTPTSTQQIQISQPLIVRKNLAKELAFNMLIPYMFFMPLSIYAIYWLIRLHLRPIELLKTAFSQRDYNDLTKIQINNLPIEIQPAMDELNSLFLRIEEAQLQQRVFIANAAHELRTPLTALRLQTDLLIKTQPNSPVYKENIIDLNLSLKRMSHLVGQLMALAHQEIQQHEPLQSLNLIDYVRQCVAQLLVNARKKNIEIHVKFDAKHENISVVARHVSLESILINLLDNAIKYSPDFGQVAIIISVKEPYVHLEVHDSGSGIQPDQRDHVMQRFVRLQETQNQVFGSGLGLSIVQSAIESINAAIQLDTSEVLGGLKVAIHFNH